MSSRSVSLTSSFLLLAAGGAAACDSSRQYHKEGFYCADAQGRVVDENLCDANRSYGAGAVPYYIYHSPNFISGYAIGSLLPAGGSRFAYNDRTARTSFGLPSTGKIGNGTVKTSVVGKGGKSTGSHTTSKSGG
jgi:hypothetical protein